MGILTLGAAHAKVCRPGWTNSEDGQCFKAFSTPKSWRDAEAKCVSEGGHLAKIMNRQQQSTVLSLLDHQPWGIKLWIGGTEAAKAGEWHWKRLQMERRVHFDARPSWRQQML